MNDLAQRRCAASVQQCHICTAAASLPLSTYININPWNTITVHYTTIATAFASPHPMRFRAFRRYDYWNVPFVILIWCLKNETTAGRRCLGVSLNSVACCKHIVNDRHHQHTRCNDGQCAGAGGWWRCDGCNGIRCCLTAQPGRRCLFNRITGCLNMRLTMTIIRQHLIVTISWGLGGFSVNFRLGWMNGRNWCI